MHITIANIYLIAMRIDWFLKVDWKSMNVRKWDNENCLWNYNIKWPVTMRTKMTLGHSQAVAPSLLVAPITVELMSEVRTLTNQGRTNKGIITVVRLCVAKMVNGKLVESVSKFRSRCLLFVPRRAWMCVWFVTRMLLLFPLPRLKFVTPRSLEESKTKMKKWQFSGSGSPLSTKVNSYVARPHGPYFYVAEIMYIFI